MGVYFKDMEMPDKCGSCRFADAFDSFECEVDGKLIHTYDVRRKDCPLVPVPPHGRMIDADALADVFRNFIAMYDSCPFSQLALQDKARRDELQAALAEVINAPTIIQASEEGET